MTTQLHYLPNERPSFWMLMILGLQHTLTMFPATFLVAILVGFDVGTVLIGSGLATISALVLSRVITGKFIPLYYGASFSYIAAIAVFTQPELGIYSGVEKVSSVQVGIIASGIINVIAGLGAKMFGRGAVERILPPILSGTIALSVGLSLSGAAINLASDNWAVATVALITTIVVSIVFQNRSFIGLVPILCGIAAGYLMSLYLGVIDYSPVAHAGWIEMPIFTLPMLTSRSLEIILGVATISLATIPESTAHLYQIGLYVDRLADEKSAKRYELSSFVGLNLIFDGVADIINGLIGGLGGTNYGENNSLMAITKNYSGYTLIVAAGFAICMGFLGKLTALVQTIPSAVTGGISIYLFGVIAMQGVAILQTEKVDLHNPEQIALGAIVAVISMGGYIVSDGNIYFEAMTLFPNGVPSIALAAIAGILFNVTGIVIREITQRYYRL